jgi:ketol-acid reductoisomerase
VAMLVPDLTQKGLYTELKDVFEKGATLLFAHGFNVHFKQIKPRKDLDVVLIAPKGPGDLVRRQYQQGRGVPCLIAVAQNPSKQSQGQGAGLRRRHRRHARRRIGDDFREETETDLFGEQAVLCGGATELVVKGYETLVEAGYQPAVAYYECLHELKLIVDLLHEGGITKMHRFISETAKYGDLTRGPRIVNKATKKEMRKILTEIQQWQVCAPVDCGEQDRPPQVFNKLLKADLKHPIEKVGAQLRARMPWLENREGITFMKGLWRPHTVRQGLGGARGGTGNGGYARRSVHRFAPHS